ncbi:MAG: energy transducer TonB [Pyrinomonadaceae bacterium]
MTNKYSTILILIFVFQFSVFPQIKIEKTSKKYSCSCEDKKLVQDYFEQLKSQQEYIAKCEDETEEKRKSMNLPLPKRISHFGLSPVSLAKPNYPEQAKRLKLSGKILVEVITDEKGSVIYSKALNRNSFFTYESEKAACHSKFRTLQYCGKPVKGRYLILYYFTSN